MTLLKVHDLQQGLSGKFLEMARLTLAKKGTRAEKEQKIYLRGQEMGFCNDDIRILLEDLPLE